MKDNDIFLFSLSEDSQEGNIRPVIFQLSLISVAL